MHDYQEIIEERGRYRLVLEPDDMVESPRKSDFNLGTIWTAHRRYDLGDENILDDREGHLWRLVDKITGGWDYVEERIEDGFWDGDLFGESGSFQDPVLNSHWRRYLEQDRDRFKSLSLDGKKAKVMDWVLDLILILPVYLYDHSGLTVSTSPFNCPWDSGQLGIIFCTLQDACKNWGLNPETSTWDTEIRDWMDEDGNYLGNLPDKDRPLTSLRKVTERSLEGEIETLDQYLTGDVWSVLVEGRWTMKMDVERNRPGRSTWDVVEAVGGYYGREHAESEGRSLLESVAKGVEHA